MTSTIINTLIAYGCFQALFIAFVLLRSKNKTTFKKLFAAILFIEGYTLLENLLIQTELIQSVPHLLGISYPFNFIKPPLLLFMAYAITVKDYQFSRKSLWHFIPFGLMLLLSLPFFLLSGSEKIEIIKGYMNAVPEYWSFQFLISLSFFILIGIYIFLSIKQLSNFKKQVINNELVNWYHIILIGYAIFLFIHLCFELTQPILQLNYILVSQISMLVMTFIIQAIAYKLISKSTVFNSKAPDLSNLKKRKEAEVLIIEKFERDKIHLDENLNLSHFSKSISLPSSYVSEIINQKYNFSFKKLVNQYRLNEAISIMEKSKDKSIKLKEIAFDSGFNNKVSFYRSFREFKGLSPSEYLEQLRKRRNGEN